MRTYEEIMESGKIWNAKMFGNLVGGLIKLPDCGTCSVMFGNNERGYEHVSISPKHKFRIPSWEDMCILKDIFFEAEEEAYQIHPKKSEYVNISENCLHLWKPIGHELGELVEHRSIPTAYDVDKVLEQLYRISDEAEDKISVCEKGYELYHDGFSDGVDKAIEIVKGGGVDE